MSFKALAKFGGVDHCLFGGVTDRQHTAIIVIVCLDELHALEAAQLVDLLAADQFNPLRVPVMTC